MSRRDQGLAVSVIGAVVLALALFAPWYGIEGDPFGAASASAWEAFSGIDIALFGCAFLGGGLAAAIVRGAADRTMVPAIHALGTVACALVLYRVMVQPEPAQLITVRWGPFVALLGAVVLAAGPLLERIRR